MKEEEVEEEEEEELEKELEEELEEEEEEEEEESIDFVRMLTRDSGKQSWRKRDRSSSKWTSNPWIRDVVSCLYCWLCNADYP